MFDLLKKAVETLKKPVSPLSLGKEAFAAGVRIGTAADNALHLSDRASKFLFDKIGPARPSVIAAADAVASSKVTAAAVKYATSGGMLLKTYDVAKAVGTYADNKLHLSDKIARALPLPSMPIPSMPGQAKNKAIQLGKQGASTVKSVASKVATRVAPKSNPRGPGQPLQRSNSSAFSAKHMTMRNSPNASFSAKHMTMRNSPSAAFSATHMTMRNASFSAKHMTMRNVAPKRAMQTFGSHRPVAKQMPTHRPSFSPMRAAPIRPMHTPVRHIAPRPAFRR